ncbi:pyruvate dehydrogenase complex dihydrolipoamide acetyltransferase [Pseudohoeflea coraliihabitans]|uniref:Acetyltransferase component of pyruvate dehydrogenase complex n=1 Tax=Pseudohoeflea coraliihabitans TaxID=2860393 RepID=A0ABS6WR66_9HYPH|nr:pyruvate dehydrogenase complex dihydrolipoamide acetyltransferase [Pseudohoeflea sp. DP4N28-3]MBW3098466.1 pyruvate dehydrogenase complex dihydrolipoamide acetyltransferase [Pseudohoeflea sp. DP4N28-3]
MPINITMPALSPTMEEGNLAKWLVKEGDTIAPGDIIAEIETDKATMEVEAVDEGTVAKILVDAGTEGVKVNAVIAVLAGEGEDPAEAAKSAGSAKPEADKAPQAAAPASNGAASDAPKSETQAETPTETKAPKEADKPIADKAVSAAQAPQQKAASSGDRIFSSPLARRMAGEANIELADIEGSGPRGRIVKRDVEAAMTGGASKAPQAAAAKAEASRPAPMSDDAVLKLFPEGSYELVKHDGMRKTIAKRLVEAKQTIPHFYVSVDCQLDALLALRSQINAAAPTRDDRPVYKVSVNDLVIKAWALALRDVPEANVSWTEDNMVRHKHADIGVAVSIPGGLITPIIRAAETKSVSAISAEMRDLGKRAKDRKLKPEEYQGGTSAVSNMGMMGVKEFSAVVNPPHATILAIGAGEPRPIVRDGELAVATVMTVTLSTDHRSVDGALGAEVLGAFKTYIENPMGMLV